MYREDKTATCPTRCAVGLLIPDQDYNPEFDTKGNNSIYAIYPRIAALHQYSHDFLKSIQIVHDRVNPKWEEDKITEWFAEGFRRVASTYFLKVPDDNV
jgi:hypothetical protein